MTWLGYLLSFFLAMQGPGGSMGAGAGPESAPAPAAAQPCTDGTDCYCDCVANGTLQACVDKYGPDITDTSVLMCEDWEFPGFMDHTTASGAWNAYDPNEFPGSNYFRGSDSHWYQIYGLSDGSQCGWQEGEPASPIHGDTCDTDTGNNCATAEWSAVAGIDQSTVQGGACIDIFNNTTSGQLADSEDPAQGKPDTLGSQDNRGVWDGLQSLRQRNEAGLGGPQGINVDSSSCGLWAGDSTVCNHIWTESSEIGVTAMVAFPDNFATADVCNDPWKDFFDFDDNNNFPEYWFLGCDQGSEFPFGGFMFVSSGQAPTIVSTQTKNLPGSNVTDGGGDSIQLNTDPAAFDQPTDWPYGDWGCVRGHITGMGTGSMRIRKWFYDTLVFDVTVDGTLFPKDGYDRLRFGNYSNRADPVIFGVGLNQAVSRYYDNVHIRSGIPVACSQMGGP